MDDFLSKNYSTFSKIMDTIAFLVVLNFLSILATIAGLLFFGIFPSIMTTHELIKRRFDKEDFKLIQTYIDTYKKLFIRANKVGIIIILLWAIVLSSWFFYLNDLSTTFHYIGMIVVGFVGVIMIFITMLMPISYAYFPKYGVREHLNMTVLMTFGLPLLSITVLFNFAFFYGIVMIRFISIFPFLAFSLPAYINMIFARKKIMKFFKVFEDENISIRMLNSYPKKEEIYNLWQKHKEDVSPWNHERFLEAINDDDQVFHRLSLVVLDQNEELVGFSLINYDDDNINVKFIFLIPNYQKRGYGKRILDWLEYQAIENDISKIVVHVDQTLFEDDKQARQLNYTFFRKHGFKAIHDDVKTIYIKDIVGGE
jgi:uncharacterized membrane protein YesL/GNAT superfamily N-acetyltransferase